MPALMALLGAFIAKVLLAFGIGVTTYTVALPPLRSFIQSQFTSLPPEVLNMVGILRLDIAMTIILSAAIANVGYKTTISAMTS